MNTCLSVKSRELPSGLQIWGMHASCSVFYTKNALFSEDKMCLRAWNASTKPLGTGKMRNALSPDFISTGLMHCSRAYLCRWSFFFVPFFLYLSICFPFPWPAVVQPLGLYSRYYIIRVWSHYIFFVSLESTCIAIYFAPQFCQHVQT